jgi:hypothetical protein
LFVVRRFADARVRWSAQAGQEDLRAEVSHCPHADKNSHGSTVCLPHKNEGVSSMRNFNCFLCEEGSATRTLFVVMTTDEGRVRVMAREQLRSLGKHFHVEVFEGGLPLFTVRLEE